MYNNSWKGNKEAILAFSSRSGEYCNLTCKTFTLAHILAHSNRICGNLNLHECVKLRRKKMLLIHFYKTQRSILHTFLLRNLKRQWSPTLTTYPLSSQLRQTSPHNSLLCWVCSLFWLQHLPKLLHTHSYLSSIQSGCVWVSVEYIHFSYRLYSPQVYSPPRIPFFVGVCTLAVVYTLSSIHRIASIQNFYSTWLRGGLEKGNITLNWKPNI